MRLCVFTGTRAEYGLLKKFMDLVRNDDALTLLTAVTGAHLKSEYGYTAAEIRADGFEIDAECGIMLFEDTKDGVLRSVGLGLSLFADTLRRLKPDIAVILGDRYEMFAAAQSCFFLGIPVAHIHGGEVTEGAFDDALRHCITKLSSLHFVSADKYRERIIRMGEQPDTVFTVGALGLDALDGLEILSEEALRSELGLPEGEPYLLVTYHPETNDAADAAERFQTILNAVEDSGVYAVFTHANADPGGIRINAMIEQYCTAHPDTSKHFVSLGQRRYPGALKYCRCVVGNSSSGILEAPFFNVYTLNIGNRQKGRIMPQSVLDCGYDCDEIKKLLKYTLAEKPSSDFINPYYKKDSAKNILEVIKNIPLPLPVKKFYDGE